MKRSIIVIAVALAASLWTAAPASATECTPKGCTGGCRVTGGGISVDPTTGTIVLEPPFECYS